MIYLSKLPLSYLTFLKKNQGIHLGSLAFICQEVFNSSFFPPHEHTDQNNLCEIPYIPVVTFLAMFALFYYFQKEENGNEATNIMGFF